MATTNWQNAQKIRRCKVDKRGKTTCENISIVKFKPPNENFYLAQ
jgi:hypothetical protein